MAIAIGTIPAAFRFAFGGPHRRRSYLCALGLGAPATAFYLVLLPAAYLGGIQLAALQFLTPWLATAAIGLGFGFAVAVALNLAALKRSASSLGSVGTGLFTSLLPTSLCCTSIVPTLLAALGAGAPTIFALSGKIQHIFAAYANAFIIFGLGLVALSIVFASRNLVVTCPRSPSPPATQSPTTLSR